ncbi:MAG: thioredoxin domain-containing protein [Chitinophagales bacterium]|nr:thioredoxin domain-containing protein [Chitinophagales bacterium]
MSNQLFRALSPYLLQHANNPVHWQEWSPNALNEAKRLDRLIIISIGYSACHWCHVMEHESFEDDEVAQIMNKYFISIKVDREERPDIDQIYMNAAMLIQGQGGWPLNVIALPDGSPIFAGTYFPKSNWINLLNYFIEQYTHHSQKLIEQAEHISKGLKQFEQIPLIKETHHLNIDLLSQQWSLWKSQIDRRFGGRNGAPKFVMPNNYEFLLRYAKSSGSEEVKDFVQLTLTKIALGGINDAISGGFMRYSVDEKWHIPHFEKMLYDNAQLISCYAQAYRAFGVSLFKDVIYQVKDWLLEEMKAKDGGFYAALDADSEGIEGKFYIWKWEELEDILKDNLYPFADYYHCTKRGNWEHGYNHLHSEIPLEEYCRVNHLEERQTKNLFQQCKKLLKAQRERRIRPSTDDKRICAWNALLLTAWVQAYWATKDVNFLNEAIELSEFFEEKLMDNEELWHTYNHNTSYIKGFLSDYAPTIQAYIHLYQSTFKEKYLLQAYRWMEWTVQHFYDEKLKMFSLNAHNAEQLVSRPIEIQDNVISSSNAIIARCLWQLGAYFDNTSFKNMSQDMLQNVLNDVKKYPAYYAEWSILLWEQLHPFYEVAFTSERPDEQLCQLYSEHFLPQVLPIGTDQILSKIPLLKDKKSPYIYVCKEKTCGPPIKSLQELLFAIQEK